jgi:pyruvate/2-oxoglutarate dehydrogenase complex dihydrolipoamide dehydrogenase (E3) component
VAAALQPALEADGIGFLTGLNIAAATHGPGGWRLSVEGRDDVLTGELLVAAGRRPCLDVHDLAAAGVELDDDGRPVLTDTLRTTADHSWASGDATGDLLFTHVGDAVYAYTTLSELVRWAFRELAGLEEHHRVESIAPD